jgi:hypothetical protein
MYAPSRLESLRTVFVERISLLVHSSTDALNDSLPLFSSQWLESVNSFCATPTVLDPFSNDLRMKLLSNQRHTKLATNILECWCVCGSRLGRYRMQNSLRRNTSLFFMSVNEERLLSENRMRIQGAKANALSSTWKLESLDKIEVDNLESVCCSHFCPLHWHRCWHYYTAQQDENVTETIWWLVELKVLKLALWGVWWSR